MLEVCMFDIMDLPEASLSRVLPKAPVHVLVRLVFAYPRAAGRTFLDVLAKCLSQATFSFLQEEMAYSAIPSVQQIRSAERELIKLLHEENLIPLQADRPEACPDDLRRAA